ncbi:aminoglycoside 3'-phosphotransferase [Deinococcus piscis]|uniref:Aminoglycoside 3'-phosphotransferase n=1 Tax=Deinococcus piscis TaxID=394230 RepID=A0ABQ3JZ42_9DEIO|nr:APH(3') family aminoglycoside O-phosphotransferase [Deinococcus piscis]GHF95903.1 aminoglycoside 3'-phosphotransferase [Deinococcus piscis]
MPDTAGPQVPPAFSRILPVARWEPVTLGESGAEVWRSTRHILKIQPHRHPAATSLADERERLRWLAGRVPVPTVLGYVTDSAQEYLAMERVPGIPMSHPDATLHAGRMADLLARALRGLHSLPARDCPFTMTLPVSLRLARERVEAGLVDESDFDPQRQGQTAVDVLVWLVNHRPQTEDIVVTHGDACLPNFIVQGEFVEGLIDVGRAGLADRHTDLALAVRSIRRNLGSKWVDPFLDTYGRELVDDTKLDYYAALDDLA